MVENNNGKNPNRRLAIDEYVDVLRIDAPE